MFTHTTSLFLLVNCEHGSDKLFFNLDETNFEW